MSTFPDFGNVFSRGNIVIGNDVWIGMNVTIMDGLTIEDGAVIGAEVWFPKMYHLMLLLLGIQVLL